MPDDLTQSGSESAHQAAQEAFAARFSQLDDDVLRVCRRMMGSLAAAEDARGEVFLRARRGYASYDEARPFRPWLLAIAGNACIDLLRRQATERRLFTDETDEEALPAAGPSPLTRLVAGRERAALDRAIEALPLRYRLPLVLRYFGDEDYAAIAEVLSVSRNQVGSLLFRAKRMLRASLEAGDAGRGDPEGPS